MNANEILKTKGSKIITASPTEAIWTVLRRFRMHQVGALVVTDDGVRLLGLLGERELVNGLVARGNRLLDLPVEVVMAKSVPTCKPEDSVTEVMQMMTDHRTRHVPVVEDGHLRGLISIGDLVKAVLDDAEHETRVLRDIARARS